MDRSAPPPPPMLGQPSVIPSPVAESTIYALPAAPGPGTYYSIPHQHHLPQSAATSQTLRRGPKRAARGDELGGAPGEPLSIWGNAADANGAESNASAACARLGAPAPDRDSSTASPTAEPQRKKQKQKRNKPTLSCFECVERKTKACAF